MNPTLLRRLVMVLCLVVAVAGWPDGPAAVFGQAEDGSAAATQSPDADADAVPEQTPRPSVQSLPVGATIAIIPVQDEIYGFTKDSIERRVDRAIGGGADLIVFDFDTPGGVLVSALEISSYINTIPVPTVGWVNRKALSAGILLASACDEIIMARSSLTGDCAPIIPGRELAPTERAKALSPLLEAFRANADENHGGPSGSDYALFHAMCALGVEVYQVRHKDTGEVRLVNAIDYAVMVSGDSPDSFNGPGGGPTPSSGITPGESAINRPDEAQTVAALSLHLAGYDDQGQWELVRKVHDGNTLLTLTEKRALEIGLSKATVSNEAELLKLYGAGTILQVNQTWSENLAGFFIHPVVRGVLMLVFIIGLLLEYFSPGLIIPSVVAFIALGILIGAPFVVGLAQVWHVLLLLIGIGLIIIELIATPTFGVLGIVGVLMMLTGFVLSVVPTGGGALPAQGTSKQIISASMSMVVAFVLTIPAFIILTRYFGTLPFLNKLILVDEEGTNLRNQAGEKIDKPYTHLSGDEAVGSGAITVGMTGTVTATGLRPSGRVEIDEQLIDVTSPGTWVEPGTAVRVAEVHGNVIVVEPIEEA